MNVDSIGEVKILTQGYQAEYGRSSGLQITAVTKSGSNQFRGSAYDIQTNSDWDSNSWVNEKNGDPKVKTSSKTLGYSIGGPVGKPGGNNKLFFFYSHEYRPVTAAINSGNVVRIRVPTAAERAGDFSQTRDNTGALFNLIHDPNSSSPCTAANTAGCFQAGGVLGRIPADRLYPVGTSLLSRYPLPNVTQLAGMNYNYEAPAADDRQPDAAAGHPRRLPVVDELPGDGQILRPACTEADHPGNDYGIQRRPESVPLHHQLRGDGGLHHEPDDLHRGHVRVHPKPARRRSGDWRERRQPESSRRHPRQPVGTVQHSGLSVAVPECRRGRSALLREHDAERSQSSLVGRQQDQPAAGVRVGQPDRTDSDGHCRCGGSARAAQPALSRVSEHQPHAGCRHQSDEGVGPAHEQGGVLQQPQLQGAEHRRRRRGEPRIPGLRELRQRHQQRPRYRLRLCQRGRSACSRSTCSSRS